MLNPINVKYWEIIHNKEDLGIKNLMIITANVMFAVIQNIKIRKDYICIEKIPIQMIL
ncbi:hypothetical protein F336_032 [Campylobacter phage F336]|uniref:Uncharacterized protein n=1 Tax=Campylobacter phage F336 TaxID=2794361 RepID=A0A7T3KDX2_9CAUD|nr:hypothetical protein F336_032 [Campylobacter phage F336]